MAFLEDYTLLDELGQGGFATVYKVRHNELGYIRAVRVMNAVIARGAEDKTYQRFIDECRLLMRLGNGNHPNIIHICKTLLKEQRAAVEMDYVDGTDLMKYVGRCGGFVPMSDVMRLLEQIASALAYCHHDIYRYCMDRVEDDLQDDPDDGSKVLLDDETKARLIQKYRVIHNDIHSNNIIRREGGNYVLLDFGLAIHGDNVVRSSRRSDGAPEFKAPEKWDGDVELTTQSDIYSFGVVLYEYLTGRVPFPLAPEEAGSAKAIYLLGEAHKTQAPEPIFELRKAAFEKANPGKTYDAPDYPQWLEDLVMKCLEKNPQDRFLDGKELYDHIVMKKEEDTMQKEEKPEAEPEVRVEYVTVEGRPAGKGWKIAAIAAAVLALLAVGGSVLGFMKAGEVTAQLTEVSTELEEALKPVVPLDAGHAVIKYLDGTIVLSKEEMEEYSELDGLWDALNTYDYTRIASYFPLLQMSDTYSQVLMRVKSKKKVMDQNFNSGHTFADDGEDEIALIKYLFALR